MENAIKKKGRSKCAERHHLDRGYLTKRRGGKAIQKTYSNIFHIYFIYIKFSEANYFSEYS